MSRITRYVKLVRDGIPEVLSQKGVEHTVRMASTDEREKLLLDKLFEEVTELSESGNPEELADIYEVLSAIMKTKNWDPEDIEKIRLQKLGERGGFENGVILEETKE